MDLVIPIMVMGDIMVESMDIIIIHRQTIITLEEQLILRVGHMKQGVNLREELPAPLVQKVQQQNLHVLLVEVVPEPIVLQEMTTVEQLTVEEVINPMRMNIQQGLEEVRTEEMYRKNRFREENLVQDKDVLERIPDKEDNQQEPDKEHKQEPDKEYPDQQYVDPRQV